ncbi:Tn3 family transposase [Streptomyces sp. URMC 127]|uniref:Tn3 family transposase n=1 Tax=Streptomyces sp. URMC 127 TaxID=3423402 RepID=UPI003F1A3730
MSVEHLSDDHLRVAGSLQSGKVRAYDLLRMMTSGDRVTGLGDAFAHYGRIFKILHLLQFIDSEAYRCMIGVQPNIGEGRHALGRRICFGRLGELRHGYRDGMEDQLGALGLALNAVVWWNTLYIDAAVDKLEAGGVTISPTSAHGCPRWSTSTSTSTAAPPSSAPTATALCGPCALQ